MFSTIGADAIAPALTESAITIKNECIGKAPVDADVGTSWLIAISVPKQKPHRTLTLGPDVAAIFPECIRVYTGVPFLKSLDEG